MINLGLGSWGLKMEETKDYKIDLMSPFRVFSIKDNWKNSLGIWLVISLIIGIIKPILKANNQFILEFVIDFLLSFLVFGYFRLYLHNVINNKRDILPSLNLKRILLTGLSLSIILLPFLLLEGLLVVIYLSLHSSHNPLFNFNIFSIIISTILVFIFIIITIYMLFIECSYLKDFKFKEGFRYIKTWRWFKTAWIDIIKTYFLAFIIIIPLISIYSTLFVCIVNLSIEQTINLLFVLSSIYYSLIFITIKINLIGQVYNNTLLQFKNVDSCKRTINKEKIIIIVALFILILFFVSISEYEMLMITNRNLNISHLLKINDFSKITNINEYLMFIFQKLFRYTTDYLLSF